MSELKFRTNTQAEETGIRGFLEQRGVKLDREATSVDEEKLAGSGIDVAALKRSAELAGHPGEIDLALVRTAALLAPDRPDVAEKRAREVAKATLANVSDIAKACIEELGELGRMFARGEPPPKENTGKLQAKTQKLRRTLDDLSRDGAKLAWFDAGDFRIISEVGRTVVDAHRELAARFAAHLERGGPIPSATHLQLIEELKSDALNIGGWSRSFTDREELYGRELEALYGRIGPAFGKDRAWFDAHFEVEKTFAHGRFDPIVTTRAPMDLDLSGRGLSSVLGRREWAVHKGNLDLSNNELESVWSLPGRIEGSLSLANNALTDLRSFSMRKISIEGDLDLSNNKHLRSLDYLDRIQISGDLNLVGVPATSLPYDKLKVGGKVILHASQTSLIDTAKRRGMAVEVVGAAEVVKNAFVPPADQAGCMAFLRDVDRAYAAREEDLHSVMMSLDRHEVFEELARELLPISAGNDDRARKAYYLVGRYSYKVGEERLAAEVAKLPEDPAAPIPDELRALPTWKLESLVNMALGADLDDRRLERRDAERAKSAKAGRKEYPEHKFFDYPLQERATELLLERARSGAIVNFQRTPLDGNFDNEMRAEDSGNTIVQDAAFELIARGLTGVRTEKGGMYCRVAWGGDEVLVTDLLHRFRGYSSAYEAMERTAQRFPENDAFMALYDYMRTHKFSGDNMFVAGGTDDLRTAIMREHVAVLKNARAPLRESLEIVRGVGAASTAADAERAAGMLRGKIGALSKEEAGALLQDIYTRDRLELAKNPDGRVRVEMMSVAAELLGRVDGDRLRRMTSPLLHAATSLLYQRPEVSREAVGLLDRVYGMLEANTLAWMVNTYAGPLGELEEGRQVIARQLDRVIAGADKPDNLRALRWFADWASTPMHQRKDEVLARLREVKHEGEAAEMQATLIERLSR